MKNNKAITLFLVIVLVISCVCYYIRIIGGDKAAGMVALLMFTPSVAAGIVKLVFYRGEKIFDWNLCNVKYLFLALFIPTAYLGFSYGLFWIFKSEAFTGTIEDNSVVTLLLTFLSGIILSTGEEIGWRGFLFPKMNEQWGIGKAVLISGLIWAVWHFPLIIAGLYQSGTPIWYQLPMFTIEVLTVTAIMGYLRVKSKSIWPAILFHASHNFFDQIIFSELTESATKAYFVGETGFITIFFAIAIAIFMFARGKIISK